MVYTIEFKVITCSPNFEYIKTQLRGVSVFSVSGTQFRIENYLDNLQDAGLKSNGKGANWKSQSVIHNFVCFYENGTFFQKYAGNVFMKKVNAHEGMSQRGIYATIATDIVCVGC